MLTKNGFQTEAFWNDNWGAFWNDNWGAFWNDPVQAEERSTGQAIWGYSGMTNGKQLTMNNLKSKALRLGEGLMIGS